MPGASPSGPLDASSTVRGLINTLAQPLAGVKTFLALIVASAGIQVASLFNTNGSGATDVAVKAGTSLADGSVNATAKVFSVRTGIGGTEVEGFFVNKSGQGTFVGYAASNGAITAFYAVNGGAFSSPNVVKIWSEGATNAGDRAVWSGCFAAAPNADVNLHSFGVNLFSSPTALAVVKGSGRIDQSGTDSTGSPGAATINKPIGKSAIAAGSTSVVITNSLVTAASHVVITPHARDATCKELIAVAASGSFTVSGTANATAALPFSWKVSTLL